MMFANNVVTVQQCINHDCPCESRLNVAAAAECDPEMRQMHWQGADMSVQERQRCVPFNHLVKVP